jgi:hypothetical protein
VSEIGQENIEELGRLADRADSLLGALELPLSPEMHIEAVTTALQCMSESLKTVYREVTGEDPWEI